MGPLEDAFDPTAAGSRILDLMHEAFFYPRSITGQGVRDTLRAVGEMVPDLQLHAVPSGEPAFDWTVPPEWNVVGAYVEDSRGHRIVDFDDHPLHLVSYSVPVERTMTLQELKRHLHSIEEQPDAIPYRTSYYKRDWGFCLPHKTVASLTADDYRVVVDTTLEAGVLNYGEAYFPGRVEDEIILTAHVCHPAQANDNLSGTAIAAEVATYLARTETRYSYRLLWIPGGIGSLVWLSRNEGTAHRIRHGMTLACLGDDAPFTYKKTLTGMAPIDLAARVALGDTAAFSQFAPYGFDERNFTSPGFRLDVGSLTRSPHGSYPEYHSSQDDMSLMSRERLAESARIVLRMMDYLESGTRYMNLSPRGEPQLGKRGLYGSIGGLKSRAETEMAMLWLLSLSDGRYSDIDISQRSGLPVEAIRAAADALLEARLIELLG